MRVSLETLDFLLQPYFKLLENGIYNNSVVQAHEVGHYLFLLSLEGWKFFLSHFFILMTTSFDDQKKKKKKKKSFEYAQTGIYCA